MKTLAALLVQTGHPLEIVGIDVPPLKRGQVLVEIAFSGACGTQVMEIRGDKGPDRWLPHCLGHEGTGRVLELGEGVTKVQPGQEVVLSWLKGSGIEAGGATYRWADRAVNAGGVTTFQRHAVISENRLTPVPAGLPLDVAVLLGCAAPTGMGSVFNVLRMQPGDTVAVFGTGGVGLNACLAAALAGGSVVVGVDPSPTRRAMALRLGATHVLDPGQEDDIVGAVQRIVPGGVDLALEASGHPTVMRQALRSVRGQGGRAVVVGNAKAGQELTVEPGLFNQGRSLLGSWGGESVPDRDFGRFGRLLALGRYPVRDLLSKPYSLARINDAIDDLSSGAIGRPMIDLSLS